MLNWLGKGLLKLLRNGSISAQNVSFYCFFLKTVTKGDFGFKGSDRMSTWVSGIVVRLISSPFFLNVRWDSSALVMALIAFSLLVCIFSAIISAGSTKNCLQRFALFFLHTLHSFWCCFSFNLMNVISVLRWSSSEKSVYVHNLLRWFQLNSFHTDTKDFSFQ